MKVHYTLVYNRKNRLRKDGTALIQIRAYLNPTCKYFSTNIYVEPSQWNIKRLQVIRHPNSISLNKRIQEQISEMEAFELEMSQKQDGRFHLHQFDVQKTVNHYKSFTQFFGEEMEKEAVKASTKQTYRSTFTRLQQFRRIIYFDDLTYKLVRDFDSFLEKKGAGVNTKGKYHKNMKKFINLAIRMDLLDINKNPYKKFTVKKERTTRSFLYQHEVERIAALKFQEAEAHLNIIRDMFLFSCYTGLRYSDVSRMSKVNILKTGNGQRLNMKSQKTSKQIQLPLFHLFKNSKGGLSKPEEIIHHYLNIHIGKYGENSFYNDLPFFRDLTEPYVNRKLKIIAKKAGIDKNLTTHVARHTFGTNLATKVKPVVLQKLMQHSHLKETMIYVHMSNQLIDSELNNVKW